MAMLSNHSYSYMREIAVSELGFDPEGEFHTSASDLRKLGERVGVLFAGKSLRDFKDWVHLPDMAILGINSRDGGDSWHWVIFVREDYSASVIDPKRSVKANRRTDFGRMKPFTFLPVVTDVT